MKRKPESGRERRASVVFILSVLWSLFGVWNLEFGISPSAAATPQETALFLAGVPVRGTALEPLSRDDAWVTHATEFDTAWRDLEARQLAKIRTWAETFMPAAYAGHGPMLYFFSGPDALYAHTFFPNAATYVLAGLEPIGPLPDVGKLAPADLAASLDNLRRSLNSVLRFSFFITKDMKVDLTHTQLSGTLPVLYVFLARAGCRIERTELVGLDKAGAVTTGKAATSGVRIVFTGPGGREQTLYYFTTDLSDAGIKANPAFVKFCEQIGPSASLLKAASYLMHSDGFSAARTFLLGHCHTLVADDSGIPLRHYDPARWTVRLFGSYPGPIELFAQHHQPQLAEMYARANAAPLEFGFGYRWQPSESTLLLATPKVRAP
jgi:hypothetical protein